MAEWAKLCCKQDQYAVCDLLIGSNIILARYMDIAFDAVIGASKYYFEVSGDGGNTWFSVGSATAPAISASLTYGRRIF